MEPSTQVSVLMPVYNAQRYLREAVQSILDQTFHEFEFVIVDDGSTDRSLKILRQLASTDPRIRVISRPNTGIVGALNDGLQACTADLIARMDADDVAMPERFARQIEYLNVHPECVCVGSRVMRIDPHGGELYTSEHKLAHDEIEDELLHGSGWAVVHPAAMMRKQAVLAVGAYLPQFQWSEDLDLFLRLAEYGKLANLPDVLLKYRQHLQSVNSTRHDVQMRIKRDLVSQAYARRGKKMPTDWSSNQRTVLPNDEQYRRWGWLALKSGNIAAARKHAASALKSSPFSLESWRLTACALRGR